MSGRQIHLFRDRDAGRLVLGVNAPNPLTGLAGVQDEIFQVTLHNLEPVKTTPAIPAYREIPTDFSTARAAVCPAADSPPRSGTFKLTVVDQTTTALTWPTDLSTPELIATWKASVLAALIALSNIAPGDIVADDPTDAPGHFLYFRWTDITRDDPISVTENRLIPDCAGEQFGTLSDAGYSQLIKLSQLPYKATETFTHPTLPPAEITSTMTGTTGVNAEQVLYIPSASGGSFALQWSGARTASLDVLTVSASEIAVALNAIVANGASDPSFAVSERTAGNGRRFTIIFIGPLAAAPQVDLVVVMLDQLALPYTTGALDLRGNLGIEQALNGNAAVDLVFELTLDAAEKYLIPLRLANSATNAGTMGEIIASGGVITVTEIVYVDNSTADPFVTATPGLDFSIPEAGSSFTFEHDYHSFFPGLEVYQRISADPETWRLCKDTEYGNGSVGDDHTNVTFGFLLSDTELIGGEFNPLWRGNWKVRLISPDAAVIVNNHKHTWDDVLASLPSGQSVRAKFAAIDAALGIFSGVLHVQAQNIDGLIEPGQLDLALLATQLVTQTTFSTALTNLFASNTSVINTLITQLSTNTNFVTALTTLITNNSTIVDAISNQLVLSNTFISNVKTLVYDVLQGGGNLPDGATILFLDDLSLSIPAPQEIVGPSITTTVPATITSEVTDLSGNKTTLARATTETVVSPTSLPVYPALSPALIGRTSGGTVTGKLTPIGSSTQYFTVTGSACSRSARGRRGQDFATGTIVAFAAGHWDAYKLLSDSTLYPCSYERVLRTITLDDTELFAGSRLSVDLPVYFQLAGNCMGRCQFVCEQAVYVATGGGTNIEGATWQIINTTVVHLSEVARLRKFSLVIERASGGTLTGTYKRQGQPITFTPVSANLALRFRLTKFDCEDNADPRGSFTLRIRGASASIAAL